MQQGLAKVVMNSPKSYLALIVPDVDVRMHEGLVNVDPLIWIDYQHLT